MNLFEHHISTKNAQQMTKVTNMVREDVARSGVKDGIIVVYSPHTTAGFTINENADPDVVHDMLAGFEEVFPLEAPFYRHAEGNSAAHLKAVCVGSSVTIPVENGRLLLGMWQGVYFAEFDGPRERRFYVKVLGDPETKDD